MKLEMNVAALALLVALAPAGFAQQAQPIQPAQTPQAVPMEKAAPAPDNSQEQQPQDETTATPAQASGMQDQPESATQTFTGTVVKVEDQYVLKTTDNMTYQLDDQDRAKEYEGKQVKVTGDLQAGGKVIHIQNIDTAMSDH